MSESRSKYALYSFLDDLADSLKTWQQLVKDADGKDVPPLAFAYMSQAYANARALHVIRALADNATIRNDKDMDDDVEQVFTDFLRLNKSFLQDCADGASLKETKMSCVDLLEKLDKLNVQLKP